MATFLFDDIVFGPVKSRRLGQSLGINLLPENAKVCNFNCVYCECGWTQASAGKLPTKQAIFARMKSGFQDCVDKNIEVDVITFAGNGEPTLHPDFSEIVDETIRLRNLILPQAKIAVLTNAGNLHKSAVRESLKKIDMAILKLDSAIESTVRTINQPAPGFRFETYIENIKNFPGRKIIQSMFLKYRKGDMFIDNASEQELEAWINALKNIQPELVMIYSVARDTPDAGVQAHDRKTLEQIAKRVQQTGFHVEIS
ncbi:MAG: radical SAM protein [Bacteroidales bacterium]|jgi:wyosine [tRNA(Phe)-imidazoG37] synthetase (radical SAM superfamily)|nr:radical SAM protein [Bacteroidales bacterium]